MLRVFEHVHCRGKPATICPAITLVNSRELIELKTTGTLCRHADLSSGRLAGTYYGQCLSHQKTNKNFQNDIVYSYLEVCVSLCVFVYMYTIVGAGMHGLAVGSGAVALESCVHWFPPFFIVVYFSFPVSWCLTVE